MEAQNFVNIIEIGLIIKQAMTLYLCVFFICIYERHNLGAEFYDT